MRNLIKVFYILLTFQVCIYSQSDNPKNKLVYRGPYRTNEHWLFLHVNDTIQGNWTYLTPLPHPLVGVNSIYIPELNKIFICGGADSSANPTNKCYLYNLNTNIYETADTLPTPRWLGKLVRVKDSLYLIGSSSSNFYYPDGNCYRYDIFGNNWQITFTMPVPYIIESAVCVWHDSLIVTIGGSTSGFSSPTDIVRLFDPANNTVNCWYTIPFPFYYPTTASQAECIDDSIIVVGGINGGAIYNNVIHCFIRQNLGEGDTTNITWAIDSIGDPNSINEKQWGIIGNSPYPKGIYRAASGQYIGSIGGQPWGPIPIFGPAIYSTLDTLFDYGQFWTFTFYDSTWHRFLPNTLVAVGNISTVAIKPAINPTDSSIYFYIFGGNNDSEIVLNKAEQYSFFDPVFGIHGISKPIPVNFKLYQNYPNPFNPTTTINYEIPKAVDVRIFLYDILGREVKILVNEHKSPGKYSISFNASGLASGVYFYTLYAGDYRNTKKLVVLK